MTLCVIHVALLDRHRFVVYTWLGVIHMTLCDTRGLERYTWLFITKFSPVYHFQRFHLI